MAGSDESQPLVAIWVGQNSSAHDPGLYSSTRPLFTKQLNLSRPLNRAGLYAEEAFIQGNMVYKMSSMESGSLTQKDGAIFSLTARDLQNHKITLFSSIGRGPVGFSLDPNILLWGRVVLLNFEALILLE